MDWGQDSVKDIQGRSIFGISLEICVNLTQCPCTNPCGLMHLLLDYTLQAQNPSTVCPASLDLLCTSVTASTWDEAVLLCVVYSEAQKAFLNIFIA